MRDYLRCYGKNQGGMIVRGSARARVRDRDENMMPPGPAHEGVDRKDNGCEIVMRDKPMN